MFIHDCTMCFMQEDLYFTSSMLLPGCRLDNKVVKTADGGGKSLSSEKRNFSSTSKLSQQQQQLQQQQQQHQQQQPEGVYIYKIVAEYMTGSQRPSSAQSMNEGGVGVGVGGGGRSSRGSEEDDLAASDPECSSSSSNSNSTAAVMQMSAVPSPAVARQPSPSPSPLACRRQLSPSILVSSEEVKLGSPLSHKNNRKIPPPPPPKPKPSSNSSHSSSSNAKQQKMFVLEDVDYVEDSEDSVGESASLDRLGLGGSQCSSPDSGVQEVDSTSTVLKTPPTISRMKVLNSSSPDYPKSLF